MARSSDLESGICFMWKVKKPSAERPRYSPCFKLLGVEWNLQMSYCYVHRFKGVHYTVYLQQGTRQKDIDRSMRFRVTTHVEDSSSRSSVTLSSEEEVKSTNQVIWSFEDDEVFKTIPSFRNHGKCIVSCVFSNFSPDAFHVSSETESTDSGLVLTEGTNLSIGNWFSKECVQESEDIPPGRMSFDFLDMLERKIFIDLKLMCDDGTTSDQRSALAALSGTFAEIFRSRVDETETSLDDVTDLNASVLGGLSKYMQSAESSKVNEDIVVYLYTAGHEYAMHSLTKVCSAWMQKTLTKDNCVSFLTKAAARKDGDLKEATISFISRDHSEVLMSEIWSRFAEKHSKLANEVYHSFVKSTIKQSLC